MNEKQHSPKNCSMTGKKYTEPAVKVIAVSPVKVLMFSNVRTEDYEIDPKETDW